MMHTDIYNYLKQRESVEFISDLLSHLIQVTSHEVNVGLAQLVYRFLQNTLYTLVILHGII